MSPRSLLKPCLDSGLESQGLFYAFRAPDVDICVSTFDVDHWELSLVSTSIGVLSSSGALYHMGVSMSRVDPNSEFKAT